MGLCCSLIGCRPCLHRHSGWKRYPTCWIQTVWIQTVHKRSSHMTILPAPHTCDYKGDVYDVWYVARISRWCILCVTRYENQQKVIDDYINDYLGRNMSSSHSLRSEIIAHTLTWLSAPNKQNMSDRWIHTLRLGPHFYGWDINSNIPSSIHCHSHNRSYAHSHNRSYAHSHDRSYAHSCSRLIPRISRCH